MNLTITSGFSANAPQKNRFAGKAQMPEVLGGVHLEKLHTTELGVERIRKNLCLNVDDVVGWCKRKIQEPNSHIRRKGKNWYVTIDGCMITINAHSHTIITAHKEERK